ncbi:MAG: NAD(P)-dependent oxidoreductase [Oscillospiraceae bacterium]|nr:NAD(P)-dependent oxidoreductase [Oscillospiraceae bacterium]
MNKVLVTGACGLIGEHICSGLLERGNIVVALDSKSSQYNENKENYRFEKADYADKAIFERIFRQEKIDAVIHVACTVDNDLSNIVTSEDMKKSQMYDDFLYSMALESGVGKFILIGTSQVYEFPKSREPIRETDKVKIDSNYAKLKYDSERRLATVINGKTSMISAALRVAPVYTNDYSENLLSKIIDPDTKSLFIYHNGEYGFHFCCLHNLVEFILCFLKVAESTKYTGIYNICDEHTISVREIIKYARERNTFGPVLQRKVNMDLLKNKLGKITNRNEAKTNYRYIDLETFFNNNILDGTKAKKVCNFKWNIDNTK